MESLLSGVALITGASAGIGRAIAISFAKHGVTKFALLDIDTVGGETTTRLILQHTPSADVLFISSDIGVESSVVEAVRRAIMHFKRIDYGINNAGIAGAMGMSTTISTADFRKVLEINMVGMWIVQRELIKQMLKQEPLRKGYKYNRGVIVNMSSMHGLIGSSRAISAVGYTTSKHGILGFTKCDANCYGSENIRINAICPGYVETAAFLDLDGQSNEFMKGELAKIPLNRFAQADEVAEAVCFLASPMSSYMNGSHLILDGGYTGF